MYTLYSRPGSGGFVAEAALAITGAPFRLVNVARDAPGPDFLAISPLRQVPALVLPDGRAMTESAAISIHLADLFPASALAPRGDAPERADFLRWMLFMSSALYPALLRYFYAERYTADPAGSKPVMEAALSEADRGFLVVERALSGRDWLVGDGMTIADIYLLMLAHWHPVADRPREEWVNIVSLCARLAQHPVVAELNRSHRFW